MASVPNPIVVPEYGLGDLFDAAKVASNNAYAPYSRFHVGAALITQGGAIYSGCNVENVAYPLGTCAEAAAIAAARVAEGPSLQALEIVVYAEREGAGHVPCSPCGGCRQRILELGPNVRVHFYGPDGKWLNISASDLLPYAFTF